MKGIQPGTVTITAASAEVPEVTGSIDVQVVRLAKSVAFEQKEYDVILGQTAQLAVTVGPEDTTDKSVTYLSLIHIFRGEEEWNFASSIALTEEQT